MATPPQSTHTHTCEACLLLGSPDGLLVSLDNGPDIVTLLVQFRNSCCLLLLPGCSFYFLTFRFHFPSFLGAAF